jgi:hypothetical protein
MGLSESCEEVFQRYKSLPSSRDMLYFDYTSAPPRIERVNLSGEKEDRTKRNEISDDIFVSNKWQKNLTKMKSKQRLKE